MPFLDLKNIQTYRIIRQLLKYSSERPAKPFQQKEIIKNAKVSKAWVSKVLKRLEMRGYVAKVSNGYLLRKPLDLISLFPLFRSMQSNLLQTLDVQADREGLLKYLKKKKVVFCTTSALQRHSTYFKDPAICFYSTADESILENLRKTENGLVRVNIYKPDLLLELDIEEKAGMLMTSKIRTIIDLFCDNKAHTADELIKKMW